MKMINRFSWALCLLALPLHGYSAATLSVDLSDSIRTATHVASGSLYGLTESLPSDIDGNVAPLKPNVFVCPARSGNGRQQPIGGAFLVSPRIANTTGKIQIRLADVLPGWPYKFQSMDHWKSEVKSVIEEKKKSSIQNFDGYEIWNEPYGTWKQANNQNISYHDMWRETYQLIRSLDPGEKIIGPSFAYYSSSNMDSFLKYCKSNNCLPDVICWHQWGSGGFVDALNNLRSLEDKYGISHRPVCINEYCAGSDAANQKFEGCPGYSVPFIAKFERHGVESAMISWWFTGLPGRLGSLLTAKNERGGGWWLYKWYGEMEGYMARVTPPNDKSDGVDGFAAVDRQKKVVSVVLGGKTLGDIYVPIKGIPSFLGSRVNVKVECVTWSDKDSPVAGTNLLSEQEYDVNNGAINLSVNITNVNYAYRIYITSSVPQSPYMSEVRTIPGRIEAEHFDLGGEGKAYHDEESDNQGNGSFRVDEGVDVVNATDGLAIGYTIKGEWLEYTVKVTESGLYDAKAMLSSGSDNSSFVLSMDGKTLCDTIHVPNGDSWDLYSEVDLGSMELTEGEHVLRLHITGSYVNVDWLEFSHADPTGITYLSSDDKEQAYTIYDMTGVRLMQIRAANYCETVQKLKTIVKKSGIYLVKSSNGKVSKAVVTMR